ncbi:proline/glycine betaine ABC transporter permease [Oxalobacter vibrioformis]|uniref:Proline/glycine betaine ABC transporter permease n=1 Tax=Oxalobacter vibrioformis TaxID=933080 RepID=A0A9E9P1Z9_9BURK|nr:proline/glycine betaine ABC transporter permease [Oxalobacter vibrioformis]NLC23372.1 proline/glycine betaine ABC transporter permease [Oxalobacter sp.]WAW09359.1 proline/glycine betaine ABC transporter permease [Oxalobacter vibrioformis]
MFPENLQFPIEQPVNDFVDWLVRTHGESFEAFSSVILNLLLKVEGLLRYLPWWGVILIVAALIFGASRKLALTLMVVISMMLIGVLGMWDLAMQTLALMIFAVLVTIVLGIPLGILMALSPRMRWLLDPMLDAMQTLPSFVYLIPAMMLFGLGKVPALFATVIYAAPPLIRLTELGIRSVNEDAVEASLAFGATRSQLLLKVQLPLALPSLMTGINQATMMALSMVVIASMIGARGLGEQVLYGIQRLDVGRGFTAGICIVLLAVVFDRINQAWGKRLQTRFGKGVS